jgi:hypothetical protein
MTTAAPNHEILAIHVPNREQRALGVQEVLTKHGKHIKTRLGIHDAQHGSGLIIVEMMGNSVEYASMERELTDHGAEVRRVTFTH